MTAEVYYYSQTSSIGESEDTTTSLDSPDPPVHAGAGDGVATACLPKQRKTGRKKFKETRHPVYRGVRHRDGGKWVCEVREPYKKSRIWLGTYPTAKLAVRAYDVAALALRGEQAALNLPDSVQLAPRPKSNSARDIRLAALQATRFDLCASSSSSSSSSKEKVITCPRSNDGLEKSVNEEMGGGVFWDEEAMFNMPMLIDSMAEGMLLTPPALKKGVNWDEMYKNDDEVGCIVDLDLW